MKKWMLFMLVAGLAFGACGCTAEKPEAFEVVAVATGLTLRAAGSVLVLVGWVVVGWMVACWAVACWAWPLTDGSVPVMAR